MTAIILEDEQLAANRLKRMILQSDTGINVLEVFSSIQSLINHLIESGFPDLLFLDVHVADGNSFELFDLLEIKSNVIFTTAFDEYAVKAFRSRAIDYLLKPVKAAELEEAIKRATKVKSEAFAEVKELFQTTKSRFLLRIGTRFKLVRVEDIAYLVAENKLVYFVLNNGDRIGSDHKLHELENQLPHDQFFRVNRQFIVHLDAIGEMMAISKSRIKLTLVPKYEGEIVVSSENAARFKSWLDR